MPIVIKWNPAYDILTLDDTLNQMLTRTPDALPVKKAEKKSAWTPAADMYETDDAIIIHVELGGIDKKSLEIIFQDGYLILQGNRPFSPQVSPTTIHRIERTYGAFQRIFRIPKPVDPRQVSAAYEQGILTIRFVKLAQDITETIKVPVTFE